MAKANSKSAVEANEPEVAAEQSTVEPKIAGAGAKRTKIKSAGSKKKSSSKSAKQAGTLATAARLGVQAVKNAAVMAAVPSLFDDSADDSTITPTQVTAPDVVATVLGWLTKTTKVIIIRDSDGRAVAGLVTYKWLKRHLDKKELRKAEDIDAAKVNKATKSKQKKAAAKKAGAVKKGKSSKKASSKKK